MTIAVAMLQAGPIMNWLIAHHKLIDYATEAIAFCSLLHTILPPWDWKPEFITLGLREFPAAQRAFFAIFNNRWYRVSIYIIGYIALNARSTVWRYISVNNAAGPNANTPSTVIETVTSEKLVIPQDKPTSGGD